MMRRAALRCLGLVLGGAPQLAFADAYLDASRVATELETQGRLDAAAEALEAIAPSYPQDLDLALRMAWLRFRAESYRRAFSHYETALKISPLSIDGHLGMGWTLERLSRCDEARAHFLTLATQNPNHAGAKEGLLACPEPAGFALNTSAFLTGMAYAGHYERQGGIAVSPRLELVIDGKWLIGAAYRYSEFFLQTQTQTQVTTPGMPPRPGVPPMPPMTTTVTTISSTTFDQHEAYLHAGYSGTRLSLIARYAFLVDSRGLSQASHHAGLGLRISSLGLGDAQLQFATSVYSDLTIVRLAPSWRLPIAKGFSVQLGGVGQWASGSLLGNGFLEFSYVRGRIAAYAGGSYGEQLRPVQLELSVITNMYERVAGSAWAGVSIRLPRDFRLLVDYRFDRLRKLSGVARSTDSSGNYFTLGLSKAF